MLRKAPESMHDAAVMTCEQLSKCCNISMADLGELVGYSALVPIANSSGRIATGNKERWTFSAQWLKPLCAVSKLRSDFDLDLFTVAIVLGNLQRIDVLEHRIQDMQEKMHCMAQEGVDVELEWLCEDCSQLKLFQQSI